MEGNTYYAHPTAVIDDGATVGAGTRIWHFAHLMSTCSVGAGCIIGQNVFAGNRVVIGNRVKVQNNVSLYEGVIIEDDVFLGPSMVFTNVLHPRSFIERKDAFRQTVVRRGATIGANATILCGTEIGAYAMVGAGSVVTRDVSPFAQVTGNPARQTGWVSETGIRLHFNEEGIAQCPETHQLYHLTDKGLQKLA